MCTKFGIRKTLRIKFSLLFSQFTAIDIRYVNTQTAQITLTWEQHPTILQRASEIALRIIRLSLMISVHWRSFEYKGNKRSSLIVASLVRRQLHLGRVSTLCFLPPIQQHT